MDSKKIVIGVAATRRGVFSKTEAKRYKDIVLERLKAFDAEIVDIEDINEEGLLYREEDLEKVIEKFKTAKVDGVFFPHTNFGTEFLVAKAAKALEVPVLLWGPRDDAPLDNGIRTRDSQCGMFATGKILRRYNVPFTYLVNGTIDDKNFVNGFEKFIAVCSVVSAFKNIRILQISTRPDPFWTMIINEGELLEKFGIEVFPVALSDIVKNVHRVIKENGKDFTETKKRMSSVDCSALGNEENINKIAALKTVMKEYCQKNKCLAVAIQCWDAMQDELNIMPCMSNGLLTEEGIPVACETDIHGAISAVMLQEATRRISPVFFADLTVRHPENDNAELLWHCGNFPVELAKDPEKAFAGGHFVLPSHCAGTGEWEIKRGHLTICRFDGDNGDYSLFMGQGKAVEGPSTRGTYVWMEVPNWDQWEKQLVTGPYVHHCAGVHSKAAAVLYEACKYIPGLKADPAEPTKQEIETCWLKG